MSELETINNLKLSDVYTKSESCDFCESKDGVMTFYIGEFNNETVIGRVCVKCVWKALTKCLSEPIEENGEDGEN